MKYSIVLPVRNGGHHLRECVKSILLQEQKNFTLHILDNASTDGSLDWVRSLKDERIDILPSEKSLTIEDNWARVVQVRKHEYMTLIGHDDILLPHFLSEMDDMIRRYPDASLYHSHYDYMNEHSIHKRFCLPIPRYQSAENFLACQMSMTIDSMGTGYVMRSADYDNLGGIPTHYPNLMFADYELWVRLMSISFKATSFKSCFRYREHESVSTKTNGMVYQQAFGLYFNFIVQFVSEHPEIKTVIDRYGKSWLLKFCESLSHRLLKTPISMRTITVRQLVSKFIEFAAVLVPTESFDPYQQPKIRYAAELDSNALTRFAFQTYKKVISK
jgi:glycosyltransferase involved in cell wall biosynthesis